MRKIIHIIYIVAMLGCALSAYGGDWHTGAVHAPKSDAVAAEGFTHWGVIDGVGSQQWLYTRVDSVGSDGIASSLIELCGPGIEGRAKVLVEVAESTIDKLTVVPVMMSGFFSGEAGRLELMVQMTVSSADGSSRNVLAAYDVRSGALAGSYEADYVTAAVEGEQRLVIRAAKQHTLGTTTSTYDDFMVYTPTTGLALSPVLACTWSVPTGHREAYPSIGSNVLIFPAPEGRRYALAHYSVPYTGLDHNAKYLIKIFSDTFQPIDTITLPVQHVADFDVTRYLLGGCMGEADISVDAKGDYSVIVTKRHLATRTGDVRYTFDVFGGDGSTLGRIATNVTDWRELMPIHGERQMVFVTQALSATVPQLRMIDLPSGRIVGIMHPSIDGKQLSYNFDRYPTRDGGYEYAFDLLSGEIDGDGLVSSLVGWYSSTGSLLRYDRITMGDGLHDMAPKIRGSWLNPYILNTDSKREYFGEAYVADAEGVMRSSLVIYNDCGETLDRYYPSAVEATLADCGIVNDSTLYAIFYSEESGRGEMLTLPLPLTAFEAGGSGTPTAPYLIETSGQLSAIRLHPQACYRLAADIDLADNPFPWLPIPGFSGHLEGAGHTVSHLVTDPGEARGALFAELAGAHISRLHLLDGNVAATDKAAALAVVADNSDIEECSANRFQLSADTVGGLTARLTGSRVTASAMHGNLVAAHLVGGIAAEAFGSSISNSHVSVSITSHNAAGAVLGCGDAAIERCVAHGNVHADNAAAGLIGVRTAVPAMPMQYNIVGLTYLNGPIVGRAQALGGTHSYDVANYASCGVEGNGAHAIEPSRVTTLFMEQLGYRFGADVSAPWFYPYDRPKLYYEQTLRHALALDVEQLSLSGNESTATVAVRLTEIPGEAVEINLPDVVDIASAVAVSDKLLITLCPKANGAGTMTVSADGLEDSCEVSVTGFVGIESVSVDSVPEAIYTLEGIKINAELSGLEPGIYIVGGRKVLIRR